MRALWALCLLPLLTLPAQAGQGLICDGEDVAVHVPLAGLAGIVPLGAEIEVAGRRWSMGEAEGSDLLVRGQSHATGEAIRIDFLDRKDEQVVRVRLRLFSVDGGEAVGGVLQIVGTGAWPVACSFG